VSTQKSRLILQIDELLLDVTNDTSGYYSKDTVWVYSDETLNIIEISFIGETDTLTEDCMASVFLYYFIDTVHHHIFTYSQFNRDSVNRTHTVRFNVQEFKNKSINYQFLVFVFKNNNLNIPQFIRLRDIKIYEVI
jgi:hypothetical protein